MRICCTKKLLQESGIKPENVEEQSAVFSWHAHLIPVNRKKMVILVNDASRYPVILYGLKKKDYQNFDAHCISAMRETFLYDNFTPGAVDSFLSHAPVVYARTQGAKLVRRMNQTIIDLEHFHDEFQENVIVQVAVSQHMGDFVWESLSAGSARKVMEREFESFYKGKVNDFKVMQICVTLDLGGYIVWRKLIVPYSITFDELHRVLQAAFNWQNYHMYEFRVFDGERSVLRLSHGKYMNEYTEYDGDLTAQEAADIKLEKYIPRYKCFDYAYDFGDNWHHKIEIEAITNEDTYRPPVCIDGNGDAPPEDVGGSGGYEDFRRIMDDPSDEEFESTNIWATSLGYEKFDVEKVNKRLKYSLRR